MSPGDQRQREEWEVLYCFLYTVMSHYTSQYFHHK